MMPKPTKNRAITETDKQIGERIRQCRTARGLSQQQVAEVIGVTYTQMHKYEQGRNRIWAATLYEIARFFNVPIEYFYNEQETLGRPADDMALKISRHFSAIKNKNRQEAFSQLVRALALEAQTGGRG